MEYEKFIVGKSQIGGEYGFKPIFNPDYLYDFQRDLIEWATRKGRAAIFADCGLGKTPMQLVWSQNVIEKTNKPVLIITPLAVSGQTLREAEKFDINAVRSRDGKHSGNRVVITNYERVHYFDPEDFAGVVCDESSAIKNFDGKRQGEITEFMRTRPYRLLCTATASPNDYIELGTSAEALGEMGRMDMLSTFFKNDENSLHPIWWGARWRFKAHAEERFWRWVVSWARAIRRPSDMGYDDSKFLLPELKERDHVVDVSTPREGELFVMPAIRLDEQRKERRMTIDDRCRVVSELVDHKDSAVVWCHLNTEGDMLTKMIPDAVQVSGADSDEEKEERFLAFVTGDIRVLVTKPKIGAFGLNWQHCNHMTFFPSHSFEQYYQAVRRCWRFGQTKPVTIDLVTTPGEIGVMKNLQRKSEAADKMFERLVTLMGDELRLHRNVNTFPNMVEVPEWLQQTS